MSKGSKRIYDKSQQSDYKISVQGWLYQTVEVSRYLDIKMVCADVGDSQLHSLKKESKRKCQTSFQLQKCSCTSNKILNITENTLGLKPRQKNIVLLQEAFEEIISFFFFFPTMQAHHSAMHSMHNRKHFGFSAKIPAFSSRDLIGFKYVVSLQVSPEQYFEILLLSSNCVP